MAVFLPFQRAVLDLSFRVESILCQCWIRLTLNRCTPMAADNGIINKVARFTHVVDLQAISSGFLLGVGVERFLKQNAVVLRVMTDVFVVVVVLVVIVAVQILLSAKFAAPDAHIAFSEFVCCLAELRRCNCWLLLSWTAPFSFRMFDQATRVKLCALCSALPQGPLGHGDRSLSYPTSVHPSYPSVQTISGSPGGLQPARARMIIPNTRRGADVPPGRCNIFATAWMLLKSAAAL
ncbi:hypothetical protein TTRE_0000549801 [Trichuris trichiura]|uniref:Uncharacterized protein n=1 Tax=Trichuris trichiura TaxID=36087 RepID=A0A077ZA05_TRITR|nr:hypothetical protein TTRE_0000549801 [Trichuris trichiura]